MKQLALSALLLIVPSGLFAQGQMQCQRLDTPAVVRAEGVSELLNDVVLSCTGGQVLPSGALLPVYSVLVMATVPLTSRPLSTSTTGLTEALLLVDDPPFASQVGCAPASGSAGCPEAVGTISNPNVFQGRQIQSNLIAFQQIPVNPPGAGGTRRLRITNLRANIASLGTQPLPHQLQLSVTMTDSTGTGVSIQNAIAAAAAPQAGTAFSVRLAGDQAIPFPGPALSISPAALSSTTPQAAQSFNVKFTEGYAAAFKRRNIGTSIAAPSFATNQATPGFNYETESGFFNSLLPPATGMNQAGLADTGTRLRIALRGVAAGVGVWVSYRDVQSGTTGYSATNAKALLTAADGNGLGVFDAQTPQTGLYVELPVVGGTASADWEVLGADPSVIESFSFSVAVTAVSTPAQGTATVAGGIAPLTGEVTVTIPSFANVAAPVPAFAISSVISTPALSVLSAAALAGPAVAPGSIVSAFGVGLATAVAVPSSMPLPTTLGNTSINIIDAAGLLWPAALYLVSPSQANFVLDPQTTIGPALVTVSSRGSIVATGTVQVNTVAPALFSANASGSGVAAGQVLRSIAGVTTTESMAAYNAATQSWLPVPLNLGTSDLVFLTLYGTGIRNRASLSDVRVSVNSLDVPVTYAGAQPSSPGLDQVNIGPLPPALAGSGTVGINISVGTAVSNTVTIQIQ
jgi:uncharacterized protein (TIGR03437 family)